MRPASSVSGRVVVWIGGPDSVPQSAASSAQAHGMKPAAAAPHGHSIRTLLHPPALIPHHLAVCLPQPHHAATPLVFPTAQRCTTLATPTSQLHCHCARFTQAAPPCNLATPTSQLHRYCKALPRLTDPPPAPHQHHSCTVIASASPRLYHPPPLPHPYHSCTTLATPTSQICRPCARFTQAESHFLCCPQSRS